MLGIERAVIDLLGQMWGVMLLNCVAALFSLTGLLGICAGDISIIILVSPALLICQQKMSSQNNQYTFMLPGPRLFGCLSDHPSMLNMAP